MSKRVDKKTKVVDFLIEAVTGWSKS